MALSVSSSIVSIFVSSTCVTFFVDSDKVTTYMGCQYRLSVSLRSVPARPERGARRESGPGLFGSGPNPRDGAGVPDRHVPGEVVGMTKPSFFWGWVQGWERFSLRESNIH